MSTQKNTPTRQDNAQTLARLISLFPEEGVDKWVLRHLWTDCPRFPDAIARVLDVFRGEAAVGFLRKYWTDHPLLPECADRGGFAGFRSALGELSRQHAVFLEKDGNFVRMDGNTRSAVWKEMGQDGPYLADTVSDFLAAWLGFTPFTHARLRDFAKTSLLGHDLAKEVRRFNQKRSERVRKLVGKPLDAAMAETGGFRPDGRNSPLIWAEFLERVDDIVFPGGDDPYFVRGNLRRFLRRHWVYAFLNRGYGPLVNGLFDNEIDHWNFFDRLVALQLRAAPAERLFAGQPEWRQEAEEILRRMEDAG